MRIVFGTLGLLVVVAIVGLLAKKQLHSAVPPTPAATVEGVATPTGTPKQQLDQFRQSVESAVQQPRPAEDEAK